MNKFIVKSILDKVAHIKFDENNYIINDTDIELVKSGLFLTDHTTLEKKEFITYKEFFKRIQKGVNTKNVVNKKIQKWCYISNSI